MDERERESGEMEGETEGGKEESESGSDTWGEAGRTEGRKTARNKRMSGGRNVQREGARRDLWRK